MKKIKHEIVVYLSKIDSLAIIQSYGKEVDIIQIPSNLDNLVAEKYRTILEILDDGALCVLGDL